MIDPDCDEEVAGITNGQTQLQVDETVNTNTDSGPANPDQGFEQVSDISLNQNLGTLYNQDFFVADTMGRKLSQIPRKSNYPYPLTNGHSALQLRLPDLLIYLKMDTYLMDVNTGEHHAVYNDRIQKMSVTPKLYSAWGYRQLLQTIQSDALRFGVNSPQPLTSGVSQRVPTASRQTQPSPMTQYMQPPASPCRPTIVKYEVTTAGYPVYNGSTGAGKTNNNASLSFSSKNDQSAAASMTLISLMNNLTGAQGCASCTQAPRITLQVSPNTSQQNSYNIPPMQPPNQFPPSPYFPIPFPPAPIAPSNVSNAHSAPVSDISAVITLMMNAVTQGNSNTTAITNALERTTTQFANALQ